MSISPDTLAFLTIESPPATYHDLIKLATNSQIAMDRFHGSELTSEDALAFFRYNHAVEKHFQQWAKTHGGGEVLNVTHPHRREEIILKLLEVDWACVDHIDPQGLTPDEVERYVGVLMAKAMGRSDVGCGYVCDHDSGQKFYYVRSIGDFGASESTEAKLIGEIAKDPEIVLTPEQLDRIMLHEEGVYKLHLNVRPDQKANFMKRLIAERERTTQIARRLRQEHGGDFAITPEVLLANGATLVDLGVYKFTGFDQRRLRDIDGHPVADFVFFVPRGPGATEKQKRLATGLAAIVGEYEDTDAPTPRYSYPVKVEDGNQHPGLTATQGDGDVKAYLERQGVLDHYYDVARNYSRRINITE